MPKPDDIPEDVWADALSRATQFEGEISEWKIVTAIARAILAEREKWTGQNIMRCEVTNNPCGTDTVAVGYDCPCPTCTKWRAYSDIFNPSRAIRPFLVGR